VRQGSSTLARIAAPAAFLLAATVLVLLVRSALDTGEGEPAAGTGTAAATETAASRPATTAETEPEAPPARTTPTEPEPTPTFYVIESGDTLESIAETHATTVERLLELNPGVDPVALTVGQRIRVA
jgi:LysM repeat protein